MKGYKNVLLLAMMGVVCLWSAQAGASPIPSLYNTGFGAGGVDSNYSLIVNAQTPGNTSAYIAPDDTWPVSGTYVRPWVANSTTSKWITPQLIPDTGYPGYVSNTPGSYTYETTFNLTGFNPGTVSITGKWWTDNYRGSILLNGVSIYSPVANEPFGGQSYNTFTISSGFQAGVNTLDFVVQNELNYAGYGDPSGLRVEFTSSDATPVPLPPAVLLLGSGLLGLSFIRRKIKG